MSTRFPAFRRELHVHRSAFQWGGCQHVIVTRSLPPQLPTKKEDLNMRQRERERSHSTTENKNERGRHTNKDKIYQYTLEERTQSIGATNRKQTLEKKRMMLSISQG